MEMNGESIYTKARANGSTAAEARYVVNMVREAVQQEREACAAICDDVANSTDPDDFALDAVNAAAGAIRARSSTSY